MCLSMSRPMPPPKERLITPDQIERIHRVTDTFYVDRDVVVIPLVGSDEPREMVLPDGKLLVRPPAGAAFEGWLAGLRERLEKLDLSRARRSSAW